MMKILADMISVRTMGAGRASCIGRVSRHSSLNSIIVLSQIYYSIYSRWSFHKFMRQLLAHLFWEIWEWKAVAFWRNYVDIPVPISGFLTSVHHALNRYWQICSAFSDESATPAMEFYKQFMNGSSCSISGRIFRVFLGIEGSTLQAPEQDRHEAESNALSEDRDP